jgi:hypothetical protein
VYCGGHGDDDDGGDVDGGGDGGDDVGGILQHGVQSQWHDNAAENWQRHSGFDIHMDHPFNELLAAVCKGKEGVAVRAQAGGAIMWDSMLPDGTPHKATWHGGCNVVKGTKVCRTSLTPVLNLGTCIEGGLAVVETLTLTTTKAILQEH